MLAPVARPRRLCPSLAPLALHSHGILSKPGFPSPAPSTGAASRAKGTQYLPISHPAEGSEAAFWRRALSHFLEKKNKKKEKEKKNKKRREKNPSGIGSSWSINGNAADLAPAHLPNIMLNGSKAL